VCELIRRGRIDATAMAQGMAAAARFQLGGVGFSGFVAETVGLLKGMREQELTEMGERLFAEGLATSIYPESSPPSSCCRPCRPPTAVAR
jgi:hypothetical protein